MQTYFAFLYGGLPLIWLYYKLFFFIRCSCIISIKNIGSYTVIPWFKDHEITFPSTVVLLDNRWRKFSLQKILYIQYMPYFPMAERNIIVQRFSTILSKFNINLIVEFITISSISPEKIVVSKEDGGVTLPPI